MKLELNDFPVFIYILTIIILVILGIIYGAPLYTYILLVFPAVVLFIYVFFGMRKND